MSAAASTVPAAAGGRGGTPAASRARALTIARQMVFADVLKLRKRRGTLAWALFLAAGSQAIFFIVRALQHSGGATSVPAGGLHGFRQGLQLLSLFVGPLAAVMIGVEAGAGDSQSGVFRDLVVTGRSRIAIFASRVPAALMVSLPIATVGFGVLLLGTYAFDSGVADPATGTVLWSYGFTLLINGVLCVVAIGLASALNSKTTALVGLIGWQLIVSPILARTGSLGTARDVLLDAPIININPAPTEHFHIPMSLAAVIATLVLWVAVPLALGAWRTAHIDA